MGRIKKNQADIKVSKDIRGVHQKCVGVRLMTDGVNAGGYVPATFKLGRDYHAACVAALNLERAWDAIVGRWNGTRTPDSIRACWDDVTFEIGKAIGRGEHAAYVECPIKSDLVGVELVGDGLEELRWLDDLRKLFPMIQIEFASEKLKRAAQWFLDTKTRHAEKLVYGLKELAGRKATSGPTLGEMLGQALEAYRDAMFVKHQQGGKVKPHGRLVGRRVGNVLDHLGEKAKTPLASFDTPFIDDLVTYWKNRPEKKRGGPVSDEWAEGVIKTIRDFVRWLHRSKFSWRKPEDYEVLPVRIEKTEEEKARKPGVKKYTLDELRTLWMYAVPRDRVWILLAMNCGMGIGEIVTLPRHYVTVKGDRGRLQGARHKTGAAGRWRLWPETIEALKWYEEKVRPQSDSDYLFLKKDGTPLMSETEGGNRNGAIPNAWARLLIRIRKDHPTFAALSFNKLRKTSANWVRKKYGKEVADLFLWHGEKETVDSYTDPRFGAVAKATEKMRVAVAKMFEGVENPFPEEIVKHNPSLSLAKRNRLKSLRQQGYTYKKIAEMEGVTVQTALRYGRE